jgi:CHAT domain-containing protein
MHRLLCLRRVSHPKLALTICAALALGAWCCTRAGAPLQPDETVERILRSPACQAGASPFWGVSHPSRDDRSGLDLENEARQIDRLAASLPVQEARLVLQLCARRYGQVIAEFDADDTLLADDDRDDYLALALVGRGLGDSPAPLDLLRAVEHASRAVEQRPRRFLSRVSHAIALESLALYESAAAALARAEALWPPDALEHGVLSERRRSIEKLLEETQARDRLLQSLETFVPAMRDAAEDAPDLAFRLFEEQFLGRWADAVRSPLATAPEDEALLWEIGSTLADAIAARGDTSLRDILTELHTNRSSAAELAAAFARGVAKFRARDWPGAEHHFAAVVPHLRAASPTLARRADYYRARCRAAEDHAAAVDRFSTLFAETPRRHAFFKGQSAWLAAISEQSQRRPLASLRWLEQARPLVEQGAGPRAAAMSELIAAGPLESLGRFEEAWRLRHAALRAIMPSADQWQKHSLLVNSGFSLVSLEMPALALPFFDEALENAKGWHAASEARAEILTQRAKVEAKLGRTAAALADLSEARRIFGNAPSDQSWNELELQVVEGLALVPTDPVRALRVLDAAYQEQSSRGEQMELLPVTHAQAACLEALGRTSEALTTLSRAAQAIEALAPPDARLLTSELKQLSRHLVLVRRDQLQLALDAGLPPADLLQVANQTHTPSLRLPPAPHVGRVNLAELHTDLAEDELLVMITPTEDRLLHFAIAPDTFLSTNNALPRSLRGLSVEQLWAPFLAPVQQLLHKPRLHLVLHGSLSRLPLHLALDPATGQPLVATHTVSYWPSLELFRAGREAAPRASALEGATVFLGADQSVLRTMHLPVLPHAASEVAEVQRVYGAIASLESGSPESFEAALRHSSLVHYAGHAVLTGSSYLDSGLVLNPTVTSPTGIFGIDHVRALAPITSQVVVLSACETAIGFDAAAEVDWGLPAELLRAGAGFVLATVAPIDDKAGATLLLDFHQGLAEGQDPPEAFRRAAWAAWRRGDEISRLFVPLGGAGIR